jgi:hypothetical protein
MTPVQEAECYVILPPYDLHDLHADPHRQEHPATGEGDDGDEGDEAVNLGFVGNSLVVR